MSLGYSIDQYFSISSCGGLFTPTIDVGRKNLRLILWLLWYICFQYIIVAEDFNPKCNAVNSRRKLKQIIKKNHRKRLTGNPMNVGSVWDIRRYYCSRLWYLKRRPLESSLNAFDGYLKQCDWLVNCFRLKTTSITRFNGIRHTV